LGGVIFLGKQQQTNRYLSDSANRSPVFITFSAIICVICGKKYVLMKMFPQISQIDADKIVLNL